MSGAETDHPSRSQRPETDHPSRRALSAPIRGWSVRPARPCPAPGRWGRAPAPSGIGPAVPAGSAIAVSKPLRAACATGFRLAWRRPRAPSSSRPAWRRSSSRRRFRAAVRGRHGERRAGGGGARPGEAKVAVGLVAGREVRVEEQLAGGAELGEVRDFWPQPTNQSPLASAWTLPWLSASSGDGWVSWLTSVAVLRCAFEADDDRHATGGGPSARRRCRRC